MAGMSKAPPLPSDHLQSVVRALRRAARFWRIGLAISGLVMAATVAAGALGKRYRSEAVVHYREGLQWTTSESMGTRRVGQRLKDVLLSRLQLARVIEELGLYPRLAKSGDMAAAVEEMRLATNFKINEGDVFVISYTGASPEEAQRVTARLTDLLIEENARWRSGQAEVARAFLDAEKKRNAADLAAKEAEQLRFLAKHPEFAHEQSALGVALRATTKRGSYPTGARAGGDNGLGALRREEERLRRQINSPSQIPRTPQDPALVAALNEAAATLKAAQRELADRRARFTEQHPDVRTAAGLVKEATDAYQRAADALQAAASVEVEPRAVLEQRLVQVRGDIARYQRKDQKEKRTPEQTAETHDAAQRIVALEAEWTWLNREVAEAHERFQQLDTRQFMAAMVASTLTSGQAAQIVVVDPAYLPMHPVGMSRTRRYLMGIAAALVFGMGAAMLLALVDDRIRDSGDVERLELAPVLMEIAGRDLAAPEGAAAAAEHSGERAAVAAAPAAAPEEAPAEVPALRQALLRALWEPVESGPPTPSRSLPSPAAASGGGDPAPVASANSTQEVATVPTQEVATVPAQAVATVQRVPQPLGVHPRLFLLDAPDSPAAASFRILRHRLGKQPTVKTVLVASPRAGEGKTTCAVNLALALCEAGRAQVLLLEANYRSPSVARLLDLRTPLGADDGRAPYPDHPAQAWMVAESLAPGLHVVAVNPRSQMRPLLDGPTLARSIEKLRGAGYDYIVIDSPAILGSADVNLMEESVDGILLTLWAGRSHAREIRRAVEQIGTGKLLGMALFGT